MFSLFLVTLTKITHFAGFGKKRARNSHISPRSWESVAEVLRRARQTKETHYNETNIKSREAKRQKAGKKNGFSRENRERTRRAVVDYGSCELDACAATARACCARVIMNELKPPISSCVLPTICRTKVATGSLAAAAAGGGGGRGGAPTPNVTLSSSSSPYS